MSLKKKLPIWLRSHSESKRTQSRVKGTAPNMLPFWLHKQQRWWQPLDLYQPALIPRSSVTNVSSYVSLWLDCLVSGWKAAGLKGSSEQTHPWDNGSNRTTQHQLRCHNVSRGAGWKVAFLVDPKESVQMDKTHELGIFTCQTRPRRDCLNTPETEQNELCCQSPKTKDS